MIRVQVELWMWLEKELGEDFKSLSEMRTATEINVEVDMTVKKLFDRFAARYPAIAEKIFNRETNNFYPNLNVMVTSNDRVLIPYSLEDSILKDGDKIIVLPLYAGG